MAGTPDTGGPAHGEPQETPAQGEPPADPEADEPDQEDGLEDDDLVGEAGEDLPEGEEEEID